MIELNVKEYKESKVDIIAKIKKYVERENLTTDSRKREYNYKRIIAAQRLRDCGLTFQEVGDILNKHHASIVHMLKNYAALSAYGDFKNYIQIVDDGINVKSIKDMVLECVELEDFLELKKSLLSLQPLDN